jgi:hypothetical protein
VARPLWREDGSVFCTCYRPLPSQSFKGPSPLVLATILVRPESLPLPVTLPWEKDWPFEASHILSPFLLLLQIRPEPRATFSTLSFLLYLEDAGSGFLRKMANNLVDCRLHGVISQKTVRFIITAVRTSNLTQSKHTVTEYCDPNNLYRKQFTVSGTLKQRTVCTSN